MQHYFFALGQVDLSFSSIEANLSNASNGWLLLAGILLFVGAMGKSAQIPYILGFQMQWQVQHQFQFLIHAATMVTAGVYMVMRFNFLYTGIEEIGIFIAYIGAFSALLAAIIATKQTDIKKYLHTQL